MRNCAAREMISFAAMQSGAKPSKSAGTLSLGIVFLEIVKWRKIFYAKLEIGRQNYEILYFAVFQGKNGDISAEKDGELFCKNSRNENQFSRGTPNGKSFESF